MNDPPRADPVSALIEAETVITLGAFTTIFPNVSIQPDWLADIPTDTTDPDEVIDALEAAAGFD